MVSCNSANKVNMLVDNKTYSIEFKKELFKRCLFTNSVGVFHDNISIDLYKKLPPPPPVYIRPSKELIDSISIIKDNTDNIIENCYDLIHNSKVEKIIKNEYKYRKIKEIVE